MRAAIAAGYAKGFRTIIDANVVTAITALILFAVATAGVKGFALMLLIGTVVSLITAVAATRAMLGLLAGFKLVREPALHGRARRSAITFLQIDFMRRRKLWFAISGVVIVVSVGSLGVARPEPRHRLQGRRPDHVQDAEADVALDVVRNQTDGDRPAGRGRPGPRHVDRRRELQELPDPAEEALARPSRTSCTDDLQTERARRARSASRTSRRASAGRSRARRSSRSSSRCS